MTDRSRFDSLQERRENFLLLSQPFELTLTPKVQVAGYS